MATNSSGLRFSSVCVSLRSGREIRLDVVVEVLRGKEGEGEVREVKMLQVSSSVMCSYTLSTIIRGHSFTISHQRHNYMLPAGVK